MDRTTSTIIVIAIIVIALLAMALGWRARRARQSGLPRPLPVPAVTGEPIVSVDGFYVATTIAGEPLNRVAVSGLGFRARAGIAVAPEGVVLAIAGEPDAFIPRDDLHGVDRATWTIDRVVETGGLIRLSWRLGATEVDSYLRVPESEDPVAVIAAIESIVVVKEASR
ncbi:hypothetical protein BH09ACT3_BH09ACT3_02430 [soil metagenome]